MKLHRLVLAVALMAVMVGVAYVGQTAETAGVKMTTAAQKFLDGLEKAQRDKATFAFDDKERTNWYFVPRQDEQKKSIRKGLPMEEMSESQKKAALDLLAAGTSPDGDKKATTI